ncbi:MAG: hypothetical protein M0D57_19240 [Sphingobacteriales bacterium JAD_PAG50586_3]|nr:MAG: hypothetical protein M0D57_19240 [Sphingobacteriales bacterium JAD_PAG50586_3]
MKILLAILFIPMSIGLLTLGTFTFICGVECKSVFELSLGTIFLVLGIGLPILLFLIFKKEKPANS